MADEKKVVSECEYKEVGSENQQNDEAPKPETKPADEKKQTKSAKEVAKTVGRVIEGALAIFGAGIGLLCGIDKLTSKRRKAKFEAWQQAQQTYTRPQETTTFQSEFHNEESEI